MQLDTSKINYYLSGLTLSASNCTVLGSFKRYQQSPLYPKLLTSQANEIQHIKLIIYFLNQKRKPGIVKRIKKQITKFALANEDLGIATN